jgi:PEP-CTERM motif
MHTRTIRVLVGALLALAALAASAQTFSGRFDDPLNTALVGSDLGAPSFVDEFAVANNVALYTFDVAVAGAVTITSTGFAAGGADPYFTLFRGNDSSATFVDSNFAQAFSTGGDFVFSSTLATGDYLIALGTFANLSFAENLGSGTLADGFAGLGEPGSLGDTHYSVTVTMAAAPVPEPSTSALMTLGLAMGLLVFSRHQQARSV